ncbi:RagB/SusD family nutrient uptake outer membrane protein [Chitinophaga pendula]|uniref:RagB/SusD family nutrient uptake outer membrane protein n=1 Tax=Chitinophaga TaxID=79328 RepID=UPI000BAFFEC3|nr:MULTISPECIES: RagB/SusD family nutrient uptake outer membrane protein [Chitinophaga]ASZ13855.1 hypothetical protein CK934_24320 [Chitinophaga sp. MD30]UCJ08522.1 RagB/SusD family nutrient uptake outer membrane protein [Chitinophaga pendula]
MKHTKIICIYLLLSAMLSCKKWLDVRPATEIKQENMFETETGFKEALFGVYMKMGKTASYGGTLTLTILDVLAQYYNVQDFNNKYANVGKYNYRDIQVRTAIDSVWNLQYECIANLNNLLAAVDQQKSVFSGQHYEMVKGEALGLRAFLHFDLLRIYGPVIATGAAKKAIPYITTFGKLVTPQSTATEIMDKCLQDLDAADSLLKVQQQLFYADPDAFRSYTRNHFNYWAVQALRARIYLYKGDKVKALQYAKSVIDEARFTFGDPNTFNATYNSDRTFSTEHIFAIQVSDLKILYDREFKPGSTNAVTIYQLPTVVDDMFEVTKGGATDYRYRYLVARQGDVSLFTKYNQDVNGALEIEGQIPLIKLPELYYIAAEASPDKNLALTYLNTIRSKRGLVGLPTPIDEATLTAELTKEYTKEFCSEGQLFFYFKRLNRSQIPRTAVQMNEATYVLPLPDNEVEFGNR